MPAGGSPNASPGVPAGGAAHVVGLLRPAAYALPQRPSLQQPQQLQHAAAAASSSFVPLGLLEEAGVSLAAAHAGRSAGGGGKGGSRAVMGGAAAGRRANGGLGFA